MASSITLYDDLGNPVVVSGEDMKGLGGIGVGQTWQDMTASRAGSTEYTNSTEKPIMINVYTDNSTALEWLLLIVDSLTIATNSKAATTSATGICVTGIIPAGSTYQVNASETLKWFELREVV